MARKRLISKALSKTLYTYVRPSNDSWVRKQAKRTGMPYSVFMDKLITLARKKKFLPRASA